MRGSSGGYVFCRGTPAFAMADGSVFLPPDGIMSLDRSSLSDTLGRARPGASVGVPITAIAVRACPVLPPTIEERIADNRADRR